VPVHINVPEPNTWRELLAATDGRPERRIAIQEYGKPAVELVAGLQARGADVTTVRVYSYGLPEDLGPLRNAITALSQGGCDVVMFTTSQQVDHLIQVAREMGLEGAVIQALRDAMIASIGPTTTEALNEYGLTPDLAPSHPKLGILVKEAAEQAEAILCRKKK
jgi:uroporphyrinogen-III synthase